MPPACCSANGGGPGYATVEDAIRGPREKVLFVSCPHTDPTKPDIVVSVDVDPESPTYCQELSRVQLRAGDEVHHSGWNVCSSCHDKPGLKRTFLVFPCLNSDNVHVVNIEDPNNLRLHKTIEGEEVRRRGVSFPHTSHCTADGNVMISTLGDAHGGNHGNFLLLDGVTFEPIGTSLKENGVPYNYDFWYQPRLDVMISTEWGEPNVIKDGFDPSHYPGKYGHSLQVFKWSTKTLMHDIELPAGSGALPLEVRFHHQPDSPHAFVGSALGSAVFHIHKNGEEWVADEVIKIEPKSVSGWALPQMPALITDILISMDDRFLYFSCWLHGDIRKYDITDPAAPKLVGQVFLGGSIVSDGGVTVTEDKELKEQPAPRIVRGKRIEGGPQMLQLSLDGKRLYVTSSLYRKWDEQFYPRLTENGATMLCIDTETMAVNEDFIIDFGSFRDGPFLGHEMRYPGGDCTSDIWI